MSKWVGMVLRPAAIAAYTGWLAWSPDVAGADSAAVSVFAQANALYRAGDYEASRAKYLEIVPIGRGDFRLLYNLGNACFKSDRIGEAIVWYERARRLKPRDDDIRANLRFVRHIKKDREPPPDDTAVWHLLTRVYMYPTGNELCAALTLLALFLFGLCAWRLWRDRETGPVWRALFGASCALTVAVGLFLGTRIYHLESDTAAVVTVEQAIARSGPEPTQTIVFIVHEGTTVHVERNEGQWSLVRLPSGLGGWVAAADLTDI